MAYRYNSLGNIGSAERWTFTALNCYKRNCVCSGCPIKQIIESQEKCHMKATVLELIRLYGIPKEKGSM